jgi:hypothetical protein
MDMARSPLLIPQARDAAFRIVLSTLFIALSLCVAVITVEGIRMGILMWPSRYEPHILVNRLLQPGAFWVAGVVWSTVWVWMFYASVAEIVYTMRARKRC